MNNARITSLFANYHIACITLIVICVTGAAKEVQGAEKPNVVLIMTDDQGFGDLSIHGNPHLQTPRIDALGRSGVRFDRFYVNSFCAPTRAALMTGRYPLRTSCHGVTHNREAMRAEELTLAEALGSAGYRTGCFGKWHNGAQFPYTPIGQGFDEFLGHMSGHINLYFDATLVRDSQPAKTEGYVSDVFTDEAIKFVQANKARPFFCYLAFNAPHSPYQVPDRYFEKFKAKGFDDTVAAFYGMCENIDDNVGRLLDTLDMEGLSENTIVLFLTDNGGTAGVKIYNSGMRGGKTSVHEGGSRVPLFMRWPAAGWKAQVVEPIVSHIDLVPTLLDLCGVEKPSGPPLDGISLRPLLEGKDDAWSKRVLFTHNPINETNRYPGAVRTQQYRLVREIKGRSGGSSATPNDRSASAWQLYDMQQDPGEKHDVSAEHPDVVARLSGLYEKWYDDTSSPPPSRMPVPVGHAEQNPVEIHAPQSYHDEPLHFYSGPGFANDWLTNWTSAKAKVWFDIDVVNAGTYEVELALSCPTEDAGSQLKITSGESELQAKVPAAPPEKLELPHRNEASFNRYRSRVWKSVPVGELELMPGRQRFTIEVVKMPGSQVMDLKHLQLRRKLAK